MRDSSPHGVSPSGMPGGQRLGGSRRGLARVLQKGRHGLPFFVQDVDVLAVRSCRNGRDPRRLDESGSGEARDRKSGAEGRGAIPRGARVVREQDSGRVRAPLPQVKVAVGSHAPHAVRRSRHFRNYGGRGWCLRVRSGRRTGTRSILGSSGPSGEPVGSSGAYA